jgi:hypothetical protein
MVKSEMAEKMAEKMAYWVFESLGKMEMLIYSILEVLKNQ